MLLRYFYMQVTTRLFVVAFAAFALAACSATDGEEVESGEDAITRVTEAERSAAQRQDISALTFDHLTPTGAKIMRASRWWMDAQDESPRYPKGRMCASNVSKVLFLSGITSVDQEGVRAFLADATGDGARVYRMPQTAAAFAVTLATIDNGHLPAGTIVAGLNVRTSEPGDQHIGFVGHSDPDGTVWVYHNNWYRPENENGQRKDHMVSAENLRRGFPRQWMPTPWIRIRRDGAGKIAGVTSLLPAIDDLDPFNPAFRVTLAVLPQMARELQ